MVSGTSNTVSGDLAFAMGNFNQVSGIASSAMGRGNWARSYGETVVGVYNTDYTPNNVTTVHPNDRVFTVGNGTSNSVRSNAMTILKNGNVGIGPEVPTAKLDVAGDLQLNSNGLLFTDTENGNATVELRASDPSYPNEGLTLRTLTNPADGEPIFRVLSSGGDERLRVEHNGAVAMNNTIQIQGGNPSNGKVLTATNNNGDAVWESRSNFVAYNKQTGTLSHSSDDNWDDATNDATLSVNNGDLIHLTGQASVRLTEGGGTDDFVFRVSYSGCTTGTTMTVYYRPAEGGSDHDNFTPIPYNDVFTTPCSGSLSFKLQIRNLGDDSWEAEDRILVVKKY